MGAVAARVNIGEPALDGSALGCVAASEALRSGPRITSGGESAPEDIAERIFTAMADDRPLLLPDRTSRLAF